MFDFTGLTIAIMRGFTDIKCMDHSWTAEKVCFYCNILFVISVS